MEPPAKRLRILHSVEVDETNPDYIREKAESQAQLKNRFESLFAKYENMPESMSDEIDMMTGKVVVDRGHLRRLQRNPHALRRAQFLDDWMTDESSKKLTGIEGDEGDDLDELAPCQSHKPMMRRQVGDKQPSAIAVNGAQDMTHANPTPSIPCAIVPSRAPEQLAPGNPSVANLMSLVQFPQTSAGQQAQSALIATINQTINHAVQQAVTPLISHLFGTVSNVQAPSTPTLPTLQTPVLKDTVTPATDPKWFFPALPEKNSIPAPTYSSPTSAITGRKTKRIALDNARQGQRGHPCSAVASDLSLAPETQPVQSEKEEGKTQTKAQTRTKRKGAKYTFSEEENVYILEQRLIHKTPWSEIKMGRSHWGAWPKSAFFNHWYLCLRHMTDRVKVRAKSSLDEPVTAHNATENHEDATMELLEAVSTAEMPEEPAREMSVRTITKEPNPAALYHLPTPSSLRQLENDDTRDEDHELSEERIQRSIAAGHFDDDEQDLLSITGTEDDQSIAPVEAEERVFSSPPPGEIVLPSIENALLAEVGEPELVDAVLPPADDEDTLIKPEVTSENTSTPFHAPSTPKVQRTMKPLAFEVMLDDDSDMDLIDVELSPIVCEICQKSFKSERNFKRHQNNHPSDPQVHSRNPTASSPFRDLVVADELHAPAPATPVIKRESFTPPRLFPTPDFKTPQSLPQAKASLSSATKASSSKADRLEANLRIKQLWAQQGRKSTPGRKTLAKRSSFATLPRKRAWDEDSGDELAM